MALRRGGPSTQVTGFASALMLAVLTLGACSAPATDSTPSPDIEATVRAVVDEALRNQPTPPPAAPLPNIEATVQALVDEALRNQPIPTPTPTATPTPRPTPTPTPTPSPTPTPRPTAAASPTPTPPVDIPTTAARVRPSVVKVTVSSRRGSGVIVEVGPGDGAFVVVSEHVILDSDDVTIRVGDDTDYEGLVLGRSVAKDLGLVWICCSKDFVAVPLADIAALQSGASLFAMGYPLGVSQATITRGVVSRTFYDEADGVTYVQTDAPINPGNSGGPLFNLAGEVVGVNTAVIRRSRSGISVEGVGFAISAETVAEVLPQLRAGRARSGAVGPVRGALSHAADTVSSLPLGFWGADVGMAATFRNPHLPSEGGWDYGFRFRALGTEGAHVVGVTSAGRWFHYLEEAGGSRRLLAEGAAPGIRLGTGLGGALAANRLFLVASRHQGWLFVDEVLIAELDLSEGSPTGSVSALVGYLPENRSEGSSTSVHEFRAAPPNTPTAGSEIINSGGAAFGGRARDLVARVTLITPDTSGPWDYGFELGTTQRFVVGSDGTWLHLARESTFPWQVVTSGRVEFDRSAGTTNHLLLAVVGNSAQVYLNGKAVARVDLGTGAGTRTVFVRSGMLPETAAADYRIRYRDFQVWPLG